ncbi:MAG: hypothetical protein RIC56_15950 [Pseudomonadales bacterium]
MTATTMESLRAADDWFLLASGNRSTVRILDGLTVGEDERGGFEIARPNSASAWLRFDVEDQVLTLRVLARDMTLARGDTMVGTSVQLTDAAMLELPNHSFRITGPGAAPAGSDCPTYRLTRRYSINWLKPSLAVSGRAPAATGSRVAEFMESPPSLEAVPEPVPEPAPTAAPAPAPEPASAPAPVSRPRVGARAQPPRLAYEPRRAAGAKQKARRRDMSWTTMTLTAVVYVVSLGLSGTVRTPVTDAEALKINAPYVWSEGNAGSDLLTEVEQLLQRQSPPDRATLEFAVEAYRLAEQRDPGRASARLRALEAQLASRPGAR